MLSKSLAQDHLSYSTGFGQIHNNTFFFWLTCILFKMNGGWQPLPKYLKMKEACWDHHSILWFKLIFVNLQISFFKYNILMIQH